MKQIKNKLLFLIMCFTIPTLVYAVSSHDKVDRVSVDISNFIDTNAVVNDGSVTTGNFNLIILGLIVVMIILIGTVMFTSKK